MAIRYVEFTRQMVFRQTKDGREGVAHATGVDSSRTNVLYDDEWSFERSGSWLVVTHKNTKQQFTIPSAHVLNTCDGTVDGAPKATAGNAGGAGKR